MVSRLKTLVTGLALVEVLALLVDEQDPRLATCPVFRVHLNYGVGGGSSGAGTTSREGSSSILCLASSSFRDGR